MKPVLLISLMGLLMCAGKPWGASGDDSRNQAIRPKSIRVECAARIFLMPFEEDSQYPVTPKSIERHYDISSCIKEATVKELVGDLARAKPGGPFNANAVRLSVSLPNSDHYLVDQVGGVRIGGKTISSVLRG